MTEPRTRSQVNAGRSRAGIVLVALLGLTGMVYLLWPKPPALVRLETSAAGSAWAIEPDQARLEGPTMGTTFVVVLADAEREGFDHRTLEHLQLKIDAELDEVDAQMSTYREDSELTHFNGAPADRPIPASAELLAVVGLAKAVSQRSGGAFDVTVGPLVDAWGFGPDPRQRNELSDAEIEGLRALVGDAKLEIDPAAATLQKSVEGLRVDLSAIAKGHGCDRVAELLAAAGYRDYMVEIGGEVRVAGNNPDAEPWRVGIERPADPSGGERVVQSILRVSDVAVATSGDYRNYFERDGVRYSHTIDPRTGRPVTHALASVTVIHAESAALADAWATALNVLGPREGLALAERLDLAAYFLIRTEAGFEARPSAAFAPWLRE